MLKSLKLPFAFAVAVAVAACGGSSKHEEETPPEPIAKKTVRPAPPPKDPDEDVEVSGLKGTLDADDIQPVMEKQWDDIQRCYAEGIGGHKYVGGHVDLKFKVARDGSVKKVQIENGDLGNWPIEKCVLEVARELNFKKPKGGEAEFSFPIDFPGKGTVIALDLAKGDAEISPKLKDLEKCKPKGDEPPPKSVQLTVYVGPHGAVTSAGFATPADPPFGDEWADCAHKKMLGWTLADPRGKVVKAQAWYKAP